jgi:hypothetical protein
MRYPPRSPRDVLPLATLVTTLVTSGIGLLYLRKWAALIVSFIKLYIAIIWDLKQALHPIAGAANWLGFLFALLLTIPLILTAT